MAIRLHDDVVNGACDDAVDRIDVGSTNATGKIEFYEGSRPANLGDAPGETLLASVDFENPAFGASGASTAGTAQAAGLPLETTGLAAGTIGWARILDRDETALWDENDVGTSGNAITVNTTTVSVGVDFSVTEYLFSSI